MSTWGPWYRVVKTIRGHRYVYDQTTRRDGRRILTRNRYIGPLGGYSLRGSLAGVRGAVGTTRVVGAVATDNERRLAKVWADNPGTRFRIVEVAAADSSGTPGGHRVFNLEKDVPMQDGIRDGLASMRFETRDEAERVKAEAQRLRAAAAVVEEWTGLMMQPRQSGDATWFEVSGQKATGGRSCKSALELEQFGSRREAQRFIDVVEAGVRQRWRDAATAAGQPALDWTPERERQFLVDVFDPAKAGEWQKPWSHRYGSAPLFKPEPRLFELSRKLGVAGVTRAFTARKKYTGTAAQDGAWFAPTLNRVQIPDPTRFNSEGAFNTTFLHELAHVAVRRTGARHSRPGFGDGTGYAAEEICVQLAADITARRLGLAEGEIGQSAAYVQGYRLRLRHIEAEGMRWALATAETVAGHLVALAGMAATTAAPDSAK